MQAKPYLRIIAFAIDICIAFIPIYLLLAISPLVPALDSALFPSLAFSLSLFYILFKDSMFNGSSLGKRWLRLRVDYKRQPCTPFRSFLRNILLLIPLFLFIELIVLLFLDKRMGDAIASTEVKPGLSKISRPRYLWYAFIIATIIITAIPLVPGEKSVIIYDSFEGKIGDRSVFTKDDIQYVCTTQDCSGIDPKRGCGQISDDGWSCAFRFSISLDKEAALRLADITSTLEGDEYLDQNLTLYLDGELFDTLQIGADIKGRPVTDIQISGGSTGLTEEDARYNTLQDLKHLQDFLRS